MNTLLKRSIWVILPVIIIAFTQCEDSEEKPDNPKDTLPSNNITSIYIDNNNIKWFGTDSGLVCFNGEKWTTYTKADGVADDLINSLAHQLSSNGDEIWVATNEGVSVHAYDVDGVTSATVYREQSSDLGNDTVSAINVDINNARWFGTKAGLTVFSGQEWVSKSYSDLNPKLRNKQITCIETSPGGWNYMGTIGDGVARYKYDEVDGITGASLIDTDWSGLPDDDVLSLFIEDSGDQWYGTAGGAAFHQGLDTRENWFVYTVNEGLISDSVLSVLKDSKGRVWFGTPLGLTQKDGDQWLQFNSDNGLSGNRINAIVEDKNGNLWFGTNSGISCFDGIKWVVYKK